MVILWDLLTKQHLWPFSTLEQANFEARTSLLNKVPRSQWAKSKLLVDGAEKVTLDVLYTVPE